jgi:hypothetical protein
MFNPMQFRAKPKRRTNPDQPRPNLLSHEKKLKEHAERSAELMHLLEQQHAEIQLLKNKYRDLQHSMEQLLNYMRRP